MAGGPVRDAAGKELGSSRRMKRSSDADCTGRATGRERPPKLYGGTERVVAWLIEELVELGHDVTLFASGDSATRAKLVSVCPRALRLGRPRADPIAAQACLLDAVAKQAGDFDLSIFTSTGCTCRCSATSECHSSPPHTAAWICRDFRMSFVAFRMRRSSRSPTINGCRSWKPIGSARCITGFPKIRFALQPSVVRILPSSAG